MLAVFEWSALHEHRWPCLKLLFGSLMGIDLPSRLLNKALKAGMKPGKPDINLAVPIGGYCGLWIEPEKGGGRKPPENQEMTLRNLAAVGNAVYACKGSVAAIRVIEDYLKGKMNRKKPWDGFDPKTKLLTA
jgi:hypothetical protein